MKIYNTLTRKKQEFKPLKAGKVLMYHCGPTVYWTQHIGNMRAMVLADIVRRSFKYLGNKLTMTRNYTDVGHLTSDADEGEDKMEKAAEREKLSPKKIAAKYIKEFDRDLKLLNIETPEFRPKATAVIPESIAMIKTLFNNGFAYSTDKAIYFDVSKFRNYNKLSGQKLEENIGGAGKGGIVDPRKKHLYDFALWFFKTGAHQNTLQSWKAYKDGENGGIFYSPNVVNGEGFPGWHLECSVMAKKYLAKTIDIHMGGVEHIPVHHTNEIAQSQAANQVPFVNYWLHNEHLLVDNKKMAKSEGTSYLLQDIINKPARRPVRRSLDGGGSDKGPLGSEGGNYNPLALRYFFLQAHYRSKQNFTWAALDGAAVALDKLRDFLTRSPEASSPRDKNKNTRTSSFARAMADKQEYKNKFTTFISDDFNIPQALALVWDIIKSNLAYQTKKKLILDFDKVLGLGLDKIKPEKITIPAEVKKLVAEREAARQNKNFKKSDELRKKIAKLGFIIEDTPKGPKVNLIN